MTHGPDESENPNEADERVHAFASQTDMPQVDLLEVVQDRPCIVHVLGPPALCLPFLQEGCQQGQFRGHFVGQVTAQLIEGDALCGAADGGSKDSRCAEKSPTGPGTQSIVGIWNGHLTYADYPNSPNEIRLVFQSQGGVIGGTITEYDEGTALNFTIMDCTVSASSISFEIDEKEHCEEPLEIWNFNGTINGNSMNGTFASTQTSSENGTWSAVKQ